jgi:hypothetical protein
MREATQSKRPRDLNILLQDATSWLEERAECIEAEQQITFRDISSIRELRVAGPGIRILL